MSDGTNGLKKGEDIESESHMEALNRFRSAQSIQMSPELFEKLYLSPENRVKGELRKTFGNPTAIAIAGFLLSLTPLSCDLMGWRGAGGNGAAGIPVYFFQGGILMILGAIMEWILGNTFPAVVFSCFGTFWLSFGGVLSPNFAAFASYAPPGEEAVAGLETTGFNASFGFYLIFMGLLCLVFLICSVRTNIVFFFIFLTLVLAFAFLTGAYWLLAQDFTGNADRAHKLVVAGGASGFATCMFGWYIFFALLFAAVDFPFQIPVGDLSTVIKGHSDKAKMA